MLDKPDFSRENALEGLVCGIDEAGRGPLAGDVVAGCVHIPENLQNADFLTILNDSKKISAKKRDLLFEEISKSCPFGVGIVTPTEIDTLNIHHASLLAMRRAFENMQHKHKLDITHALIDGRFRPQITCSATAITKGDAKSFSIAAASIIAKVTRDRMMQELDMLYPQYGWAKNAGYGTKQHLDAIQEHGITTLHRKSFSPIKNMVKAA